MKRRQFTADVYLPTDYMTLEGFYKALQRDTGVDESFFMWDYPVPENEEQYQEAVKLVRWLINRPHPQRKSDELRKLRDEVKKLNRS